MMSTATELSRPPCGERGAGQLGDKQSRMAGWCCEQHACTVYHSNTSVPSWVPCYLLGCSSLAAQIAKVLASSHTPARQSRGTALRSVARPSRQPAARTGSLRIGGGHRKTSTLDNMKLSRHLGVSTIAGNTSQGSQLKCYQNKCRVPLMAVT